MPIEHTVPQRPWLDWIRADAEAPLRLFCFHYAGGSAAVFRPWAQAFPRGIELCAVELPGRGRLMGAPPYLRLRPLVQAVAETMLDALEPKPFAFFGHSMGALVCFELVRQLQRLALPLPQLLCVSGRRAPCYPPHTAYHTLPDDELIARLAGLNGTPREVLDHPELMQLMLPMIRADFGVCETYTYTSGPALPCPIVVCGGEQDPDVQSHHLDAWRAFTTAGCDVTLFTGDHFYLRPSQQGLVTHIERHLRQAHIARSI